MRFYLTRADGPGTPSADRQTDFVWGLLQVKTTASVCTPQPPQTCMHLHARQWEIPASGKCASVYLNKSHLVFWRMPPIHRETFTLILVSTNCSDMPSLNWGKGKWGSVENCVILIRFLLYFAVRRCLVMCWKSYSHSMCLFLIRTTQLIVNRLRGTFNRDLTLTLATKKFHLVCFCCLWVDVELKQKIYPRLLTGVVVG